MNIKPENYWKIKEPGNLPGEEWREIPGFSKIYRISNLGRIKSLDRMVKHRYGGKRLKKGMILRQLPFVDSDYLRVSINDDKGRFKTVRIHRLVALAFIPNPNNYPYINHLNACKTDNRYTNLQWCTHLMNIKHAQDSGLMVRTVGEINGQHKLTENEVLILRRLNEFEKLSQTELSYAFGITQSCVSAILRCKTWNYIYE